MDEDIIHLYIDGELIETTAEHPFYTDDGVWVDAADLTVGEMIWSLDGDYGVVESVVVVEDVHQPMYNLTVDEAHTFFIGDGDWLVHNQNGICDFNTFRSRVGQSLANNLDAINVGAMTVLPQGMDTLIFSHYIHSAFSTLQLGRGKSTALQAARRGVTIASKLWDNGGGTRLFLHPNVGRYTDTIFDMTDSIINNPNLIDIQRDLSVLGVDLNNFSSIMESTKLPLKRNAAGNLVPNMDAEIAMGFADIPVSHDIGTFVSRPVCNSCRNVYTSRSIPWLHGRPLVWSKSVEWRNGILYGISRNDLFQAVQP